jgi:biopolymer transport protein ExbD
MKRRETLGIDLTPVIDVVFILLIFFIVTSVFKKDELALILDLPKSGAKSAEVDREQIYVELNEKKLALRGKEVTFSLFENELKQVKDNKKPVVVRIDKNTRYERITRVLDLLQKYNLNNLALVTE